MKRALLAVSVTLLVVTTAAFAGRPSLGTNAALNGWLPFPANDAWNTDISAQPVDPLSDAIVAANAPTSGLHPEFGTAYGIPYTVVSGSQRKVKVVVSSYPDSADMMPMPIPPDAAIEGGGNGGNGDAHLMVLDRDNYAIYELYTAVRVNGGKSYTSPCCCIFNAAGTNVLRPKYWTSTDAAGLSVYAGLVKYEDLYGPVGLKHAVRFTLASSRMAYLPPATHWASSKTGTQYAPMGARFRLKASFNTSGYTGGVKVLLDGLKKYGMIMADNGGDWFVTGAGPDSRWNDSALHLMTNVPGNNFEVVQMVGLVTTW